MNKQADNEDIRNNSPDYKKYGTSHRIPFVIILNPTMQGLLYPPPAKADKLSTNMFCALFIIFPENFLWLGPLFQVFQWGKDVRHPQC